MKLAYLIMSGFLILAATPAALPAGRNPMNLGNFSVSLAVKDIHASKSFYEKLGFVQVLGDTDQGWVILKNGSTNIGLFQGMFARNMLTFNPRWDQDAKVDPKGEEIRTIQKRLKDSGIEVGSDIESGAGPASFTVTDPDGNPIMFDQHV